MVFKKSPYFEIQELKEFKMASLARPDLKDRLVEKEKEEFKDILVTMEM